MTRDELIKARKERKNSAAGRARRRRVIALVGAVVAAAASASGLWWLPHAATDRAPSDKSPLEDTGRRDLLDEMPPDVLP